MENFLKKTKFLAFLPLAVMLSSCADMGEQFSGIKDKLFPNIYTTLIQFVVFLIMVAVVYFVAYKPIKKNLDKRRDHVAKTVRDAEDKLANADVSQKQADTNLKDSHQQGNKIIEDSRKVAEAEANQIINDAENQASARLDTAQKDIKLAKEKMQHEIHQEIVTGALEASKEILKREINSKDNDKIVDDFLDKFNENKK